MGSCVNCCLNTGHRHVDCVFDDMHMAVSFFNLLANHIIQVLVQPACSDCTMGENVQTEIECQSLLTTDDAVRVVCHEVRIATPRN